MPQENNFFDINSNEIDNVDSKISLFFRLPAPFQLTYEFCSGVQEDDYLNILVLSEKEITYMQESMKMHNHLFNGRAPHFHDHYEFLLVLEGTMIHQIEGKNYVYPAGSCCLLNRNILHKENFKTASKICFLDFSSQFIEKLLSSTDNAYFTEELSIKNTPLYDFIMEDLKNPGKKVYLDFLPVNTTITNALQKSESIRLLMDSILFPKFGSTYQINGALCEIISFLADKNNFHCTTVAVNNSSDHLLFQRISHLLESENGRLSRQDIGKQLNYSGDYINRIVHKYTSMSLHEYSMDFAIQKAANDLIFTTDSISEICIRLQFTNRTYFYKLFKNKYGITPKEYRNIYTKERSTPITPKDILSFESKKSRS